MHTYKFHAFLSGLCLMGTNGDAMVRMERVHEGWGGIKWVLERFFFVAVWWGGVGGFDGLVCFGPRQVCPLPGNARWCHIGTGWTQNRRDLGGSACHGWALVGTLSPRGRVSSHCSYFPEIPSRLAPSNRGGECGAIEYRRSAPRTASNIHGASPLTFWPLLTFWPIHLCVQ